MKTSEAMLLINEISKTLEEAAKCKEYNEKYICMLVGLYAVGHIIQTAVKED